MTIKRPISRKKKTPVLGFNQYQDLAWSHADYPLKGRNLMYPVLGLTGEAGEVADKFKKMVRDDRGRLTEVRRQAILKELGDVLWYIGAQARELGFTLQEVAEANIAKIEGRLVRGTLHGDGDDR